MSNNNLDYKLGQLDQAFQDITNRLDKQDITLANIEKKVEALNAWRIKIVGIVSAFALMGNFIYDFIKLQLNH